MADIAIQPPEHESQVGLWRQRLCRILNARVAAYQADSTAADVATLKADFNSLLAKLRTSGLMAGS